MFGIKEIGNAAAVKMMLAQFGVTEVEGKQLARPEVPDALEKVTEAGSALGSELYNFTADYVGRRMTVVVVLGPVPAKVLPPVEVLEKTS